MYSIQWKCNDYKIGKLNYKIENFIVTSNTVQNKMNAPVSKSYIKLKYIITVNGYVEIIESDSYIERH